jgi:hypothetical protein
MLVRTTAIKISTITYECAGATLYQIVPQPLPARATARINDRSATLAISINDHLILITMDRIGCAVAIEQNKRRTVFRDITFQQGLIRLTVVQIAHVKTLTRCHRDQGVAPCEKIPHQRIVPGTRQ